MVQDNLLLSTPPLNFLDIFDDFGMSDFPCVNPSMNASTFDHSQNTPYVSQSFYSGEEKYFLKNPIDHSSTFSTNTEGEHSYFSSTPLYDSSNHEDVKKHLEFSNHGCPNLCTYSFDHDVDSFTVNVSKPLVSIDLSIDEVETP